MTFRKLLLIVVLSSTAIFLIDRTFEKILLAMSVVTNTTQDALENANHSITYATQKTDWLRYDIPKDHTRVKIIANATCVANARLDPDEDLRFAVRIRVNGPGGVSKEFDYHFRTRITATVAEEDGSQTDRLFFLDSADRACDGRTVIVDEAGTGVGEKQMRVRLIQQDSRISDVLIRMYTERKLSVAQQHFRWDRLGRRKRERLARSNVYTPDLLSDDEKLRYSASEWQAIAPWGVVGKDFRLRLLYRRSDEDRATSLRRDLVGGVEVDQNRHGTIALPEGNNLVRLVLRNRDPAADPVREQVKISWFGRDVSDRDERVIALDGPEVEWTAWLEGGLLELQSNWPIAVQAFLGESGQDITPDERLLRTYVCAPGEPVDFDIFHLNERGSSFRLDLRVFGSDLELTRFDEAQIRHEYLDADGIVIASGVAFVTPEVSIYDSLLAVDPGVRLGERLSQFFSVPSECATVRVHAIDETVLVCGFSRPAELPKEVQLPEDYYAYNRSNSQLRGWFISRPRRSSEWIADGLTRVASLQFRPPSVDDAVLSGQYNWTSFSPDGEWFGRPILVRRDVSRLVTRGLGASLYADFHGGSDQVVEVIGSAASRDVELHAVFPREGVDAPIRIEIDGQIRFESERVPAKHIASLGRCALGHRAIRVIAPPGVRVLISRVAKPSSEHFVKRMGVSFDSGPITFRYEKKTEGKEVLVARFYRTDRNDERASVCAEVFGFDRRDAQEGSDWTFTKRRFDIARIDSGDAIVVGAEWENVQNPQKLVIPLRSDMPPGEYELVWSLGAGASGYMTLSRVMAGEVDSYRFFSE